MEIDRERVEADDLNMNITIHSELSESLDCHGPDAMFGVEFETGDESLLTEVMMRPFLQVLLDGLPALADGKAIVFELDFEALRCDLQNDEVRIGIESEGEWQRGPIRTDIQSFAQGCIDLAEEFHRRLSDSQYPDEGYAQSLGEKIAETKRWYRVEFKSE